MRARATVVFPAVAVLLAGAAIAGQPTPKPLSAQQVVAAKTTGFLSAMVSKTPDKACAFISERDRAELAKANGQSCEQVTTHIAAVPSVQAQYKTWLAAGIPDSAVSITGDTAYVSLKPNSVAVLVKGERGAWTVQSVN